MKEVYGIVIKKFWLFGFRGKKQYDWRVYSLVFQLGD